LDVRLDDGVQRLELSTWRDPAIEGEQLVPAEFERILGRCSQWELDRLADFLTSEFAWNPLDGHRHGAAIKRVVELHYSGSVRVVAWMPSGTSVGDIPDEDDVQPLSALTEDEEDEEVSLDAKIEGPMMIDTDFAVDQPEQPAFDFQVEEPPAPSFDFEVEPPEVSEFDFEVQAPATQ
jgi:hypothetical protein